MGVGVAATGSSGEGRDGDGDGRDGDGRPRRGTRTAATETKKKVIGFCFWLFVDRFFTLDRVCLHLQYYTYVLSFSLLFGTRQKLATVNYSISTLILARGNKLYFDIF